MATDKYHGEKFQSLTFKLLIYPASKAVFQ